MFSHAVGDRVLRRVGAILAEAVGVGERAARFGGEEFVLLLAGTDAATAVRRCTRLTEVFRATDWTTMTGDRRVTASIGVATYAGGPADPSGLLALADRHLYAAKRAGRDQVVSAAVTVASS